MLSDFIGTTLSDYMFLNETRPDIGLEQTLISAEISALDLEKAKLDEIKELTISAPESYHQHTPSNTTSHRTRLS